LSCADKKVAASAPEAVAYRVMRVLLLPMHGTPADSFSVIMKNLLVRCTAVVPLLVPRLAYSKAVCALQPNALMTFVGLVTASVPKHLSCVQQATIDFVV
jgi:hypothetical protein